jgi:hypothetical protein
MFRKTNHSTVIPFPIKPGIWNRCITCSRPFRLEWMAATIRDGRQEYCPDHFMAEYQAGRWFQ